MTKEPNNLNDSANTHSTASGYVRLIVRALVASGLDAELICAQSDISYQDLADADARFKQSSITRLWQNAVLASGDETIALKMAGLVTADSLHLLGYSMMSSKNLLEGYQRVIRYQRIAGELFDVTLSQERDKFVLGFGLREASEDVALQSIDAALAVTVGFARWLTQDISSSPIAVQVMRAKPKNSKPYEDLFKCPIHFAQKHNQMCFSKETMTQPIPTAHERMAEVHEQLLGGYLNTLDKLSTTELVEDQVRKMLPSGLPKADDVAAALNISARTLHRRLAEVDLNFQSCLEQVRKNLAGAYLKQTADKPSASLKEITYLLGFSEPSNFYRAFKRWYGMPPGQFLAEQTTLQ